MLLSAVFFALFFSAFSSPADRITIQLQNVNVLERLGLTNINSSQRATFYDRLDTILALGTNIYTARLGVGTPPQPIDFLLNWVGDLISPGVGDLSFMLSANAFANVTQSFNNSASKTFKSRPDKTYKTSIQPKPMNFTLVGFLAEDIIMFNNITEKRNITVRERSFGQVEQIGENKILFERLSVSGILNMGKQSALIERIGPKIIQLVYGKTEAQLIIETSPLMNKLCDSSRSNNYYDLEKDFGNETGPGMDAFKFKIQGVNMKAPNMNYDDKIQKTVLINPNAMFIQGPKRTVAKLALMVNAEKRSIGRHQLYMIDCNEKYGPFSIKAYYNDIKLEKENLKIELPGNLLPSGQCLWAIQELDNNFGVDDANVPWIFGRPFFQEKYCLLINPERNRIGFPEYLGKK